MMIKKYDKKLFFDTQILQPAAFTQNLCDHRQNIQDSVSKGSIFIAFLDKVL